MSESVVHIIMLPCEDGLLQLCDGKLQLRHVPAAKKKTSNKR